MKAATVVLNMLLYNLDYVIVLATVHIAKIIVCGKFNT